MTYDVTFNTDIIAQKAGAIQTTAGQIEELLGQLNGQMADLEQSYTGAGAAAFQAVYAKWRTTAAQMKEELGQIGAGLSSTGQARGDAEQQIASTWTSAL
jgi:early secretory antigenic target protein ESAT-6